MNCILIQNGLVYDFNKSTFIKKDILIEDGKIKVTSEKSINVEEKYKVIGANEKYIIPGLIDCHTHIGIMEECTGKLGIDNNETSNPITPHLRGIDGVNPLDIAFRDAVKSGVTCVMSGPGSNNAVGGTNLVLKTHGSIIDKMVVKNPSGLKIAFGEDPLSTYGTNKKCPVTRMAVTALIRELFMKAEDYMNEKKSGNIKERDIKLESVIPVLKGEIPIRAHAHRADDIITAIRVAEEFGIKKLVIEHGTEAHLVKEYIKEKEVAIAFGPMLTPRIKMELKLRNYTSIVELVEAGIKIGLMTDHPYNAIDQLRSIAAFALSEGLQYKDAIKVITVNPAEILQCSNRIGKIEEGLDADIVIYDGNPLDIMSKVEMTIIDGNIVYNRENKE